MKTVAIVPYDNPSWVYESGQTLFSELLAKSILDIMADMYAEQIIITQDEAADMTLYQSNLDAAITACKAYIDDYVLYGRGEGEEPAIPDFEALLPGIFSALPYSWQMIVRCLFGFFLPLIAVPSVSGAEGSLVDILRKGLLFEAADTTEHALLEKFAGRAIQIILSSVGRVDDVTLSPELGD